MRLIISYPLFKNDSNYVVKMRDLNNMKKRIFSIKKIKERNYKYNYFDLNIINNLIEEFKPQLL